MINKNSPLTPQQIQQQAELAVAAFQREAFDGGASFSGRIASYCATIWLYASTFGIGRL